jgi:hypothetical protein
METSAEFVKACRLFNSKFSTWNPVGGLFYFLDQIAPNFKNSRTLDARRSAMA